MQIEGKNSIKEALESNTKLSKLYVSKTAKDIQPIIDKARMKNVKLCFVNKVELDKISETQRHQGLIGICDEYNYSCLQEIIDSAKQQNQPLFLLLLDGIEDPHNLGSIIRVAECCGAHGIVTPVHRAATVNATAIKVSAGAASHVKIARVTNINDTIRMLKDNFVNVVCADMEGQNIYESHLSGDIAVVIGSEGHGVKTLTKKLCNQTISIPQYGKVNSLNASVASGIICFEIVRQRNFVK